LSFIANVEQKRTSPYSSATKSPVRISKQIRDEKQNKAKKKQKKIIEKQKD